jgi:hypothetical protein
MEVQALRKSGGELAAAPRWSRGWRAGGGSQCPAPDLQSLAGVIENGRDIIVTVSCMTYQPPLASFLGSEILGFASTTINQQVATVPRKSPTLSCNDC